MRGHLLASLSHANRAELSWLPSSAIGHEEPVKVAIRFQEERRNLSQLNGRNLAAKLTTTLPRPGQMLAAATLVQIPRLARHTTISKTC